MIPAKKLLNNWEYSLSFILDSIYNGIIAVDENGCIVLFNLPAKKMLSVKGDVVGKYIQEVLPESKIHLVLTRGTIETNQKMFYNGKTYMVNCSPIIKNGKVIGAAAVFEDITGPQKLMEEMFSPTELFSLLETVLENTPEGILVFHKDGNIEMCNQVFCSQVKMSKQDVIGKKVINLLPKLPLTEVAETGKPLLAEMLEINGQAAIVSVLPVNKQGKSDRFIVKTILKQGYNIDQVTNKIKVLRSKMEFYKEQLEKVLDNKYRLDNIVGRSQTIAQLKETIKRIAYSNSPVLLRGENGTGKKMLAHILHMESPRKYNNFIRINCSALIEEVLENELFGYVEGVSSAGVRKTGLVGKIEMADHGTLFLEEIGDMPISIQEKLLKVIQEKEVKRFGDDFKVPVDIKIIASTSKNLEEAICKNQFRPDLYYRLNVLSLFIPPLRDRIEDLELLINFMIDKFNNEYGKKVIGVSSETFNILSNHLWPGNIRELENVMEKVFMVIEDQVIHPHHLPKYLQKVSEIQMNFYENMSLKTILENTERNVLVQVLKKAGGNKVKAAKMLGISRAGLYQKLEKYNMLND